MQRVSGANFLANGNGQGKNAYQDYNPATGQAGTTPNASAFNALQEEIAGLIEAHGIALDPADNTQLQQALAVLLAGYAPVSGFASSLGAAGYQKLPGGLILQWGLGSMSGTGARTATQNFNIAFPTGCLECFAVDSGSGCYSYGTAPIDGSKTAMSVFIPAGQIGSSTTPTATATAGWRWWALGY